MIFKGCLVFTLFVLYVNTQSVCKTPIDEEGTCVPVAECTIVFEILNDTPRPEKAQEYLNKSYCSNKELVCCAPRHLASNIGSPDGNIIIRDEDELQEVKDDVSNHPSLRFLPLDRCGRIEGDKLSNANTTALGEFPWMALLQYQTSGGLKFLCGGSLISPRYVLTAAHCVTGISDTLVSVRLGEYDTATEEDCETFDNETDCAPPVQDIPVEEVKFHPDYNNPRFSNDVAVIRLKREAELNDESVQAVCLPFTLAAQRNKLDRVTISGWGLTEKQQLSTVLLKAVIPILPNERCQEIYKRSVKLTEAQMCAGGENGVDSCDGDSGGPLFFPGDVKSLRYVQYGIVSAGGNTCGGNGMRNFPGIYVRVTHYIKWILDQLKS